MFKKKIDQSFPKSARLRKQKEFQEIYDFKKFFTTKTIVLYLKPAEKLKIGFVTGKKIGKAVVRNRVKRLILEVVRKIEVKPAEVIFLARKNANIENVAYNEIEKTIVELLKKADLLND